MIQQILRVVPDYCGVGQLRDTSLGQGKQKQDRRRSRGDLPSEDHDICNRKDCGESGDTGKISSV